MALVTTHLCGRNTKGDDTLLQESPDTGEGTAIAIQGLTIDAGGRRLLEDTSITFAAGEVTLLLGCSGVGKSVLLRILAGLIDTGNSAIGFAGQIRFESSGSHSARAGQGTRPIAVVFQNFALLDELSPLQNVQIALDHSLPVPAAERLRMAKELLQELRVPTDRATAVLSGGQRQRLAIARAIGLQSDVILYDEPTSGLDVNTAVQVADLIRETQQSHRRTSLIVTHDFESLRRIADHIVLFDHQQLTLRELPRDEWHQLPAVLGRPPRVSEAPAPATSVPGTLLRAVTDGLTATGQAFEQALLLPWSLLPLWRSVPWGLRSTWHYLKLVSGWSACIYIATAGMIIGFVAQDFVFRYLPFRQFTEPLLTENLLHATGFSLYRFLVPILSTILIAARSGAAVAADVGSKVYGNQMDAMRTIGMNPERSLRTPILYAFLLGTPLLSLLSYGVAAMTAASAFLLTHPEAGIAFWDAHFHLFLTPSTGFFYQGTGWLISKLLTCGAGIAMISWSCAITPKQSGPDISHGVTRTILWSTLLTLFVHFLFSFFEFRAQQ